MTPRGAFFFRWASALVLCAGISWVNSAHASADTAGWTAYVILCPATHPTLGSSYIFKNIQNASTSNTWPTSISCRYNNGSSNGFFNPTVIDNELDTFACDTWEFKSQCSQYVEEQEGGELVVFAILMVIFVAGLLWGFHFTSSGSTGLAGVES